MPAFAYITRLLGLIKIHQVDRAMVGAMEVAGKGKIVQKVAPSILASLESPPFKMSAYLAEGLIGGAYRHKGLLA